MGKWNARQRRNFRRTMRLGILFFLLIALLGVGTIWAYYLRTRKPLTTVLPDAPIVAEIVKPHYLFSIYGVEKPLGVAVERSGDRVYVTESGGERLVKVFDREGKLLFTLTPGSPNQAERTPMYVALSPQDEVLVSDRRQHAVMVFNRDGAPLRTLNPPRGIDSWSPLGMTFRGDTLLVTDVTKNQHRVLAYGPTGDLGLAFGEEGKDPGQFWYPNGIATDSEGRIYIADSNNGRLQVFDAQGQWLYKLGGFNLPRGMAVDDDGRLYIADAVGQRVLVYNLKVQPIELLYELGDFGYEDGQFNFPNDVDVDSTGRIYIADRENNRIQVWSY